MVMVLLVLAVLKPLRLPVCCLDGHGHYRVARRVTCLARWVIGFGGNDPYDIAKG
jgi:hypothetical protein